MNSRRKSGSLRNSPSQALVTIATSGWFTPRVVMQPWLASITTATPRGSSAS